MLIVHIHQEIVLDLEEGGFGAVVFSSSIVRTPCVSRCLLAYSAPLQQRETFFISFFFGDLYLKTFLTLKTVLFTIGYHAITKPLDLLEGPV